MPEPRKVRDFKSAITSGKIAEPRRIFIYGVEGFGKSTWAAQAPRVLFVGAEEGTSHINTSRLSPTDWRDYMDLLDWFATSPDAAGYESLAIDTMDNVEKMAIDYVCARDDGSMDPVKKYKRTTMVDGKASLEGYGFGAGPGVVEQEILAMIAKFDVIRRTRGAHIILIAHSDVVKEKNAGGDDYGLITARLQKKVRDQLFAWCEAVFYCEFDRTEIQEADHKDGKQIGRAKVVSKGQRVVHTTREGAFVAKNRLGLPPVIPPDWKVIEAAAQVAYGDTAVQVIKLREEIEQLTLLVPVETRAKVAQTVEKFAANVIALVEIKGRLQTIIAAQAVAAAQAAAATQAAAASPMNGLVEPS